MHHWKRLVETNHRATYCHQRDSGADGPRGVTFGGGPDRITFASRSGIDYIAEWSHARAT